MSRLLFWGFQGTIDHRVQLTPEQFADLGVPLPLEDDEQFITLDRLQELLSWVREQGISVRWSTGGSPLISALTAAQWLRGPTATTRSLFIGRLPAALREELPEAALPVIAHAVESEAMGGTLSLEHLAASKKVMLAVPDGRWLDEELADAGLEGLLRALAEHAPYRFALGIGGLNKAQLPVVLRLLQRAAALPGHAFRYLAGGSFNDALVEHYQGPFWDDLRALLAHAEVVSVNREEFVQLGHHLGEDWPQQVLGAGATRLVVRHSRDEPGVWVREGCGSPEHEQATEAFEQAAAEAASHAAQRATGLGARFDAVLSAQLLERWPFV